MCYCPTPTLHPNLALTGDGAFLFSLKKTHSVWFISILNYGDTENVLINHLLLVIPMLYPCHYTNLCPHKPHKHAHTHTHTHTHTELERKGQDRTGQDRQTDRQIAFACLHHSSKLLSDIFAVLNLEWNFTGVNCYTFLLACIMYQSFSARMASIWIMDVQAQSMTSIKSNFNVSVFSPFFVTDKMSGCCISFLKSPNLLWQIQKGYNKAINSL